MLALTVVGIAYVLICLLWQLYVFSMAMLRAHVAGLTTRTAWAIALPFVVIAVALDIFLNFTLLALLSWDFPQQGEYTFSQRLARLVRGTGRKARVASWIARSLLDPYDHTGQHIKRDM